MNRPGRLSSPDRIAGSIGDPQSLNRHAYIRSGPINFVDPLGLDFCLDNQADNCYLVGPDFGRSPSGYWFWNWDPLKSIFNPLGEGSSGLNIGACVIAGNCSLQFVYTGGDPRGGGGGGADQKAKLKELLKNPDCAALLGGADKANKLVDKMSVVPAANAQPVPGSNDFNAWNLLRTSAAYASTAPYSRTGVVFTSTKLDALNPSAQSTVLFHELEHQAFGKYGEPSPEKKAEYSQYIRDRYTEISQKCGTTVPK